MDIIFFNKNFLLFNYIIYYNIFNFQGFMIEANNIISSGFIFFL